MNRHTDTLSCSVGIFCHNEAGNIASLVRALQTQHLRECAIDEIIVVSSASTDGTDDLVRDAMRTEPRLKLITQAKREGKSSAINLFLDQAQNDIAVIISGDVIPYPDTIELLVSAFSDPRLGATGGKPVPVNDHRSFMGYAVHLLWRLHHRMALITPKLGEMIAFRKVMDSIPKDSAVDEASIEAIIRSRGLELRYIPKAMISNKGPEKLKDFIKQRRRIQNGHLWLKQRQSYTVASQDGGTLLKVVGRELADNPLDAPRLIAVLAIEFYARLLGWMDYRLLGKNPFAWDIAHSAKKIRVD
jgi:cellulose synthase/poly-beta-1,6-N-acetylglucosamine synthase-like glycosyltransferase